MAAFASGMSVAQAYRLVLLPQAFRIVLPPLTVGLPHHFQEFGARADDRGFSNSPRQKPTDRELHLPGY